LIAVVERGNLVVVNYKQERNMRKYCKAYHLKDLRQFQSWTERREENEEELSDDSVIYLWDDFTVVRSPVIPDRGLIFDAVTSEWQQFCKETLRFEIPEDLRYAYEEPKEQHNAPEEAVEEQNKASV
jgi:hypothetical protein